MCRCFGHATSPEEVRCVFARQRGRRGVALHRGAGVVVAVRTADERRASEVANTIFPIRSERRYTRLSTIHLSVDVPDIGKGALHF